MKALPRLFTMLAGVTAACALLGAETQAPAERIIVVRAARLLDPASGQMTANPVIAVQGDRILSIGGAPPAGVEVVDAGDLTLLPGLIDTHAHNLLQPEDEITAPVITKSLAFLKSASKTCRQWSTKRTAGSAMSRLTRTGGWVPRTRSPEACVQTSTA